VARLIAQTPTMEALPIEIGGAILEDAQPEAITWVAPLKGQHQAIADQLGGFPQRGACIEVKGGRAISVGPGQAMVLGVAVLPDDAAVTDQSDGWTVVALDGEAARDVLARLTPIDTRNRAFATGSTARTLIGHMTVSITRISDFRYEIMGFRTMTQTLIHELTRAMRQIEARRKL